MLDFSSRWIAHRGAPQKAPENTLASLRAAKAAGASWVECDVMLTSDHVPVIFHDETLDRTTNAHGWVKYTPYSVIAASDAGSWFSTDFQKERVPRLQEWLLCAAELKLNLNLELKAFPGDEARLAERVAETLQQHEFDASRTLLLSSFSEKCLSAIQKMLPQYSVGLLLADWKKDWYMRANALNATVLGIDHRALNASRIANIKAANMHLLAYTVDDQESAEILLSMGVDAVFTNNPELLTVKSGL